MNTLIYSTLIHKINIAVRSRSNAVSKRHDKKLFNLRKQEYQRSLNDEEKQSKNIIHNFSSYSLTKEEVEALSYELDQHIPNYTHRNTINTEFGLFFQNVLNDISNIPEETLTNIKTKLLSSCEKCDNKKTPYKYKKVISNLSKNSSIIVLKQDKGRGVAIVNRTKYLEKCYTILDSNQFTKLDQDPMCYMKIKFKEH